VIPAFFTEEDRRSFLAIANRARAEEVNVYCLVSLGCQSFVRHIQSGNAGPPADMSR
jgi:hypothetical protein